MSKEFIVRPARPNDHPAIRALTLDAYEQYATIMEPAAWAGLREAVHTTVDTEAERFVAEQHGKIIGSVMLFAPASGAYGNDAAPSDVPELRLLAVSEAARNSGVGRALVDACLQRAQHMGATALGLHTSDSLVAAIHLYEQMGFERFLEGDFRVAGSELIKAYRKQL